MRGTIEMLHSPSAAPVPQESPLMTSQSQSLLKLIPDQADGLECPSSTHDCRVDDGHRSQTLPTPVQMAKWRFQADAHMEDALARFDAAIIGGEEPGKAAHALCHGFMEWCRGSMSQFGSRAKTPDQKREWSREQAVWMGLADLAAVDAPRDPAGVDRFLQIWLGVVHEAAATGRAWLFSA